MGWVGLKWAKGGGQTSWGVTLGREEGSDESEGLEP